MKQILYSSCLAIILLCATYLGSFSQTVLSSAINGSLTDEDGRPVERATLTIFNIKNPTFIRKALSLTSGTFKFKDMEPGAYQLIVTAVGYSPYSLKFGNPGRFNLELSPILLKKAIQEIKEVMVTFTKPLLQQRPDRTIVNVAGSILSAGNNAMEILQKLPGVAIDRDNNISLNGKDGVIVMLNDKPTYLSSAQLAALLRSTDGNLIQSVEIMSNPAAKYDAAGKSGIINIRLKQNNTRGTNGTITAGLGAKLFKDNTAISLNHNSGYINSFITLSRGDEKKNYVLNDDQVVDSAGKSTYLNQKAFVKSYEHNYTYRFGADLNLSKHLLGFVIGGFHNSTPSFTDNTTLIGNKPNLISSYLHTLTNTTDLKNNFSANLADKFSIDTAGQLLSLDLDYSKLHAGRNDQNQTSYYLPDGNILKPNFYLNLNTLTVINIRTIKLDYTYPISKKGQLQFGVKYSNVNTDNNLNGETGLDGITFHNGEKLNNYFVYNEKTNAAYASFSKNYENMSVQAGLRAEYTSTRGTLKETAAVKSQYLNWFPSLIVHHTLNSKNEITLKFSKRIDRPGYDILNPFVYYNNDYDYSKGNPFLRPEHTSNFELSYTYDKKVTISGGLNHIRDVFTKTMLTDSINKSSIETFLNVGNLNYYYLNLNTPYTILDWWKGNLNVNFYDKRYTADNGLLNNGRKNKLTTDIKLTQFIKLGKNYRMELASSYRSGYIRGVYIYKPFYTSDAGLSYSFANNKATLKLAMNDIFNTSVTRTAIEYLKNTSQVHWKPTTQNARMSLNYNFEIKRKKSALL